MPVLSFAPDLMVRSKIDVAARHYGVAVCHAASVEAFRAGLAASPALVLLDLDHQGVDGVALVREARSGCPGARVVGFCSHVLGEVFVAAREAGAHTVMANSTFSAAVPGLFAEVAAARPAGE